MRDEAVEGRACKGVIETEIGNETRIYTYAWMHYRRRRAGSYSIPNSVHMHGEGKLRVRKVHRCLNLVAKTGQTALLPIHWISFEEVVPTSNKVINSVELKVYELTSE